jgi:hypothetical protein
VALLSLKKSEPFNEEFLIEDSHHKSYTIMSFWYKNWYRIGTFLKMKWLDENSDLSSKCFKMVVGRESTPHHHLHYQRLTTQSSICISFGSSPKTGARVKF